MMSTEPLDGLSQTEHLGADGKIVVDKRLHGVPQFLDRLAGDDQVVGEGEVVPVSQGIADFEMAVGNRLLGCRRQEEAEALAVTDLAQVGEEPDGFQRCPEQQGAFQVAGSRVDKGRDDRVLLIGVAHLILQSETAQGLTDCGSGDHLQYGLPIGDTNSLHVPMIPQVRDVDTFFWDR